MKKLLYIKLARNIEQKIRDEVFKIGDKLPSIRTVCDEYGRWAFLSESARMEVL